MVVVNFPQRLLSGRSRKKFGMPVYYGERLYGNFFFGKEYTTLSTFDFGKKRYGSVDYGEYLSYEGVYQNRPRRTGKIAVRMAFSVPKNPRTEIQQANRQKFADAMAAWAALTSTQKEEYRVKCIGRHMWPFNLFVHEYLISH